MRTALDRLAAAQAFSAAIILGGVALLTAADVALSLADRLAGQWGGNMRGLGGYEDVVRLAAAAVIPMCLPWCQRAGGHVVAELPLIRRGSVSASALDRGWALLIAVLAIGLAVFAARGMLETRVDGLVTPVLGIPEWPFYLPALVGLATWAAIALVQTFGGFHDA